jgi:translation elongation factor EF-4
MHIGDKIASYHTGKKYEITELGVMHPEEFQTKSLYPGQVGYIACNMKQSSEGRFFIGFPILQCSHTLFYSQHTSATPYTV